MSRFLLLVFCLAAATSSAQDSAVKFSERAPRYRIQPNDVLEVHYRYTPEFNQTVTVQPDGFVSLNLVDGLKLAGLTLDEARLLLETESGKRLRNPDISLVLMTFETPHITVGGEVANPGRFELHGRLTAIEAIALAGGFRSASAKHSQVILFRRIDSETAETKILNIKKLMDTLSLEEDVTLRSGDLLLVPQNRLSKIERFVKWANLGVFWNPAAVR